jgi:hypothetical protein
MYEKSTAKLKLIVRVTYCLTFGFLIVMIVAFLCRWFLVRPSQSEISLNLAYSGADLARCVGGDAWVAALSPDAEVLNDHGIGFRRLEIRYRQASSVRGNISRHHLTTLGWPQPIFSSGSEWLGRCGTCDLLLWDLDETLVDRTAMTGGPATTFHWSGIIFDTITFGLPLLVLTMLMPKFAQQQSIRVRRTAVVIAAGWWLCLAIPAVGVFDLCYCPRGSTDANGVLPQFALDLMNCSIDFCRLTGEKSARRVLSFYTRNPTELTEWANNHLTPPTANEGRSFESTEIRGFAVSKGTQSYLKPHPDYPDKAKIVIRCGESMSAGWPLQAFTKGDFTYRIFFVSDLSHLDVQWLPWLGNVAVLSSGLAIICYPVGIIRRWRRIAPGQCTTCRYPLNGSAICPECGRANAGSAKN